MPESQETANPADFRVRLRETQSAASVSPTLFGLFLEDLNFGVDGGLNANLINNHSFDAVYLDRRRNSFVLQMLSKRPGRPTFDGARHWSVEGGSLQVLPREDVPGAHFARLSPDPALRLSNNGYPGDAPGIGARAGVPLIFRALVRAQRSHGELTVRVVDTTGNTLATQTLSLLESSEWQEIEAWLDPSEDALARLEILVAREIDIDETSLVPSDHWGAGDPRWSQGLLRRDLVEAIRDVTPRFLRFPGGCVVEGLDLNNAYDWKKSIGPLESRRGDYNLWALSQPGGNYAQSNQIGFYEYFLLCEDLGIKAVPVVNAGLACQMRSREKVELDTPEFDEVVQDVLDLIEWATGDPSESPWAAKRAEAGHPEPFELEIIGIGNENHGPEYTDRFARIRATLEKHRPGLTYIISSGAMPSGKAFDHTWAFVETAPERLVVDEHFYKSPDWFEDAASRYDYYRREGGKVFAGEYAAFSPTVATPKVLRKASPNSAASAVAEAAFYTGLVRNSDVVVMSSYAPLFNLVEHSQWEHNFIDFNPFTVQPTINYWVQRLFSASLGTRLLSLSAELPPGLHAVATADDRRTVLHVVNRSPSPISLIVGVDSKTDSVAQVREITSQDTPRGSLKYNQMVAASDPTTTRQVGTTNGTLRLLVAPATVARVEIPMEQGD